MRPYIIIVATLFLFFSCKRKDSIPAGIISQKKMQAIIRDMMRADQFLTDYVLNKDSSLNRNDESIKYYQLIFGIHQVSKKKFQKSFDYYRSHPFLLKAVMDSLSQLREEAPTQIVNPSVLSPVVPKQQIKPLSADTAFRLKRIKKLE